MQVNAILVVSSILSLMAFYTDALSIQSTRQTGHTTAMWGISSTSLINTINPATLDRTRNEKQGSSPQILDRPTIDDEIITEKKSAGPGAWELRIYNDGTNTRSFIARCLVQITRLSEITAYETMMQAHNNGMAVVGSYVFELAERYHDALRENGIACELVPVDEDI